MVAQVRHSQPCLGCTARLVKMHRCSGSTGDSLSAQVSRLSVGKLDTYLSVDGRLVASGSKVSPAPPSVVGGALEIVGWG